MFGQFQQMLMGVDRAQRKQMLEALVADDMWQNAETDYD